MIQFAQDSLLGVRNEQTDVLYIYRGPDIIWPGNIIKEGTGFLKYYPGNFKQSFQGVLGDPNAPADGVIKYVSTGFATKFLGPDTARNPIAKPAYDEIFKFSSSNITAEFNAYVDIGAYDQTVTYNEFNMVANFPMPVVGDVGAVHDFPHRYSGSGFGTNFLGPDTARNPIANPPYDEVLKFSSSNIASQFNSYVDVGVFDQSIHIDYSNFFVNIDGDITAANDFQHTYKGTNFSTYFLGPDTARNPIPVPAYDEIFKYSSSNIGSSFVEFVDVGVYDQNVRWSYEDIATEFVTNVDGAVSSPLDINLSYKSTDFGTYFLGPDTARNPIANPPYQERFSYRQIDGTILANFTSPADTGVLDFNLVYSYSVIPTYFLP